jgi:hypothetical protein
VEVSYVTYYPVRKRADITGIEIEIASSGDGKGVVVITPTNSSSGGLKQFEKGIECP